MKASLLLLVCTPLWLASCATQPPPPSVRFEDRPSSFGLQNFQATSPGRQTVEVSGFMEANHEAMNRGGSEIAEDRRRRAEEWSRTMASSGGGGSSGSDSGSRSSSSGATSYTSMSVTYDQHAGSQSTSGSNTIQARSANHSYTFRYDFGGSHYLIGVGGDLSGKSVSVKFEGDTPVSISRDGRVVTIKEWNRD